MVCWAPSSSISGYCKQYSVAHSRQIPELPTRSKEAQPLQNVLSVSTAGRNRYLFHFSNVNALTQWTAGIRLAMFENISLQEAYTGALIGGKGRTLNNIKDLQVAAKFPTEGWARVRFGAGTAWKRYWCVITPPNEKEVKKAQQSLKKKSAYEKSLQVFKGDVKFYDTNKTKKATLQATIRDAHAAYAIYPQSKPLIDQSTLLKVEGQITIHTNPEQNIEGFIFIMPEVRPMISGFEMLLRFLYPIWDVFALYGRPQRLAPETRDVRSLMFAMPERKRYGYLEILDVAGLIHESGSQAWSEREWRKQLKQLTLDRINQAGGTRSRGSSRAGSQRNRQNSLPSKAGGLRFQDESMSSAPNLHPPLTPAVEEPEEFMHQRGSAPPTGNAPYAPPMRQWSHQRSASENTPLSSPRKQRNYGEVADYAPSRLSHEQSGTPDAEGDHAPPPPPAHGVPVSVRHPQPQRYPGEYDNGLQNRSSSESDRPYHEASEVDGTVSQDMRPNQPPAPVAAPPAFSHQPGARPQRPPYHSPELRRTKSRLSTATLSQIVAAGNAGGMAAGAGNAGAGSHAGGQAAAGAAAAWRGRSPPGEGRRSEDHPPRAVNDGLNVSRAEADNHFAAPGMVLGGAPGRSTSPSGRHLAELPSDSARDLNGASYPPRHLQALMSDRYDRSASPSSRNSPASQHSAMGPGRSPHGSPQRSPQRSPGRSPYQASPQPSPMRNPISASNSPSSSVTQFVSGSVDPSKSRPKSIIARKPVPSPSLPATTPTLSNAESTPRAIPPPSPSEKESIESLRRHTVDEATISRVRTMKSIDSTADGSPAEGDESSHYETESAASPDYASPPGSIKGRTMPSRPENARTGVLKTVGTHDAGAKDIVIGDVHYRTEDSLPTKSDLPEIDFGPTQLYDPTKSSGSQPAQSRGHLDPRHRAAAGPSHGRASPGHVIDSYNRASNLATPEQGVQSRSGSSGSEDPSSTNRRSMAWQPGAATVGSGAAQASRPAITPEQFVQQRAAANRVPAYAHSRQQSGTPPLLASQPGTPPSRGHGRADSRTPPLLSRQSSGDWSAHVAGGRPGSRGDMRPSSRGDMRPNSRTDARPGSRNDMRPGSRGAAAAMHASGASTPDHSAHLSAREQEHVARITGSPLLHVGAPGSGSNVQRPGHAPSGSSGGSGGLIGAIEAREQEKRAMKEGWSGQMVQQAIAQRQRDQQAQAQAQAQQASRRMQQQMQMQQQPGEYAQQFAQYPLHQQHQQMYGGAPVTPPMHVPGGFPSTPPMYEQYPQKAQQQQGYWGAGSQPGPSGQGQAQAQGHPVYGAGPYAPQQQGGYGNYGGQGGRGR